MMNTKEKDRCVFTKLVVILSNFFMIQMVYDEYATGNNLYKDRRIRKLRNVCLERL